MSLATTRTTEAIALYPNRFDKQENRGQKYGLLDLAVEGANNPEGLISEDLLAKVRNSWGKDVKVPVMTGVSAANGTGLSCTITGSEQISAYATVTFATISNSFLMHPALNKQNGIKYEADYAKKYTMCMRAIAKAVDILGDTTLTANIAGSAEYKSSYLGVGNKYGALVADKIQVSVANTPNFFNDLPDILAADDLEDEMFDIVSSTNGRSIIAQIAAQGMANGTNTKYQFEDSNFRYRYSNRVTLTPATSYATMFAMPRGSLAILTRHSPDCEVGGSAGRTIGSKEWSTFTDPMIGLPMDVLTDMNCGDISALTNYAKDTAAIVEGYQFALNFAFITPYTNFGVSGVPSTIRKIDILNT